MTKTTATAPLGFLAVATYGPDADIAPMWGWGNTEDAAWDNLHAGLASFCEDSPEDLDLWIDEYCVSMPECHVAIRNPAQGEI